MDKISKKILKYKNQDFFIVFFTKTCPYCLDLLKYLRDNNLQFKGYDIDKIRGGFSRVLLSLNENEKNPQINERTGFKKYHVTKPIVFYKGKFIGGRDDTIKFIKYSHL